MRISLSGGQGGTFFILVRGARDFNKGEKEGGQYMRDLQLLELHFSNIKNQIKTLFVLKILP